MMSSARILVLVALLGATTTRCRAPASPLSATPQIASVSPVARPPVAISAKFAVIGDYGQDGPDEAAVASLVHSWNPDFIVTTGDNNYPHGKRETIDTNIGKHYHAYIRFDPLYQGPYKSADPNMPQRFFPALGNHDWYSGEGVRPYTEYFDLPGNERYYNIRQGSVEVFVIDSDPHEPDGTDVASIQAQWLKAALHKSKALWKVVAMHHPPYSRGEHGNNAWMQWPFAQWGASLVVAGHDHDYERIIDAGFPYLVVGASGAGLRGFNDTPYPHATANFLYDKKHGAMLVDVSDLQLTCRFFNKDNELIDTYVLHTVASQPQPSQSPAGAP